MFTLSVTLDTSLKVGELAELAEIVSSEGRTIVDPNVFCGFIQDVVSGLRMKDADNRPFIIGSVDCMDTEIWLAVAAWLEDAAKYIRKYAKSSS